MICPNSTCSIWATWSCSPGPRCRRHTWPTAHYGTLNQARDNVVLLPTFYGGDHVDNEIMMAPGRAIDPSRSISSSSRTCSATGCRRRPATRRVRWAARHSRRSRCTTMCLQHRLVTERFGISGSGSWPASRWARSRRSTGARCSPRWSSHRADLRIGEDLTAQLRFSRRSQGGADGRRRLGGRLVTRRRPIERLPRDWARLCRLGSEPGLLSRGGISAQLGFASIEDVLRRRLGGALSTRDANNLLAMLWTWQHADISANATSTGRSAKSTRRDHRHVRS